MFSRTSARVRSAAASVQDYVAVKWLGFQGWTKARFADAKAGLQARVTHVREVVRAGAPAAVAAVGNGLSGAQDRARKHASRFMLACDAALRSLIERYVSAAVKDACLASVPYVAVGAVVALVVVVRDYAIAGVLALLGAAVSGIVSLVAAVLLFVIALVIAAIKLAIVLALFVGSFWLAFELTAVASFRVFYGSYPPSTDDERFMVRFARALCRASESAYRAFSGLAPMPCTCAVEIVAG